MNSAFVRRNLHEPPNVAFLMEATVVAAIDLGRESLDTQVAINLSRIIGLVLNFEVNGLGLVACERTADLPSVGCANGERALRDHFITSRLSSKKGGLIALAIGPIQNISFCYFSWRER